MSLSDPRTVDDLLNLRLSCLLNVSGAMVTRLCEGRYGITRREWRLVALLAAHGEMSPSELAARAQLERARVSRLITELVAKGLLARHADAEDKRRATVRLTAEGVELFEDLFPRSVAFNNEVLAALTSTELVAFDAALAKLTQRATQIAALKPVQEKADRRHGGARRVRRG
ncbi:MarR family winged helix-turn-helix transcriptional regulator [Ramlibacter rhizophilus]|uniref:MarR family transcriptional regulator n=1 Tax=Ramlibacter rhizophilus TaxID=1781167 RepID=A0A4Z0C2V8_9BURK|nr:MarR family transcriptional regulator [Ramlibacter rhizophilus]TFZ04810.1 MarR family transcriptional regulator [Ramlibacter rhizophilus]